MDFIKKMLNKIKKALFASDVAIDLGTSNTVLYVKNKGVVINEPSVVAIEDDGKFRYPHLFGQQAKIMIGKSPSNISIVKPIRNGGISDFYVAEEMISHYMSIALGGPKITLPNVIASISYESTPTERLAIQEAVIKAGSKDVKLVFAPLAAAIGANLPVSEPSGSMILDIGAGKTEIAIISLDGIVYGKSIKIGGDKFNQSIIDYIAEKYNLMIGESTAENVKEIIGCVYLKEGQIQKSINIKGRDFSSGTPKEISVWQKDICVALSEHIIELIRHIKSAIDSAPPELVADIMNRGMVITGGSAMLMNLDYLISEACRIPVFVAPNPITCTIRGLTRIIDERKIYSSLLFEQF